MTLSFSSVCSVSGWLDSTKYLLCLSTSLTLPYESVRSRMNVMMLSGTGTLDNRLRTFYHPTISIVDPWQKRTPLTNFYDIFGLESDGHRSVEGVRRELVLVDECWSNRFLSNRLFTRHEFSSAYLLTGSLMATRKS